MGKHKRAQCVLHTVHLKWRSSFNSKSMFDMITRWTECAVERCSKDSGFRVCCMVNNAKPHFCVTLTSRRKRNPICYVGTLSPAGVRCQNCRTTLMSDVSGLRVTSKTWPNLWVLPTLDVSPHSRLLERILNYGLPQESEVIIIIIVIIIVIIVNTDFSFESFFGGFPDKFRMFCCIPSDPTLNVIPI